MIVSENINDFIRVTTDIPVWILLLKSETEYINYVYLPIGFCDCYCNNIIYEVSKENILNYIQENNLTKYIPKKENENEQFNEEILEI